MANDVPCPPSPGHHRNVPALGGPLLQNVSFWVLAPFWADQDTWFFRHSLLETKIDGEGEKMPSILGSTGGSSKLVVWIVESDRIAKPACAVGWFVSALVFPGWLLVGPVFSLLVLVRIWKLMDVDNELHVLHEGWNFS